VYFMLDAVKALDIVGVVDAFKPFIGAPAFEQANIWGCTPDAMIDALDIVSDVDAFRGLSYACPGATVDAPLLALVDALSDMEEGLSPTFTGGCDRLEVDVPTTLGCGADMQATITAALYGAFQYSSSHARDSASGSG